MTLVFDAVPAGTTLYIPFATYGGTNGESITLTGLAVTATLSGGNVVTLVRDIVNVTGER